VWDQCEKFSLLATLSAQSHGLGITTSLMGFFMRYRSLLCQPMEDDGLQVRDVKLAVMRGQTVREYRCVMLS